MQMHHSRLRSQTVRKNPLRFIQCPSDFTGVGNVLVITKGVEGGRWPAQRQPSRPTGFRAQFRAHISVGRSRVAMAGHGRRRRATPGAPATATLGARHRRSPRALSPPPPRAVAVTCGCRTAAPKKRTRAQHRAREQSCRGALLRGASQLARRVLLGQLGLAPPRLLRRLALLADAGEELVHQLVRLRLARLRRPLSLLGGYSGGHHELDAVVLVGLHGPLPRLQVLEVRLDAPRALMTVAEGLFLPLQRQLVPLVGLLDVVGVANAQVLVHLCHVARHPDGGLNQFPVSLDVQRQGAKVKG